MSDKWWKKGPQPEAQLRAARGVPMPEWEEPREGEESYHVLFADGSERVITLEEPVWVIGSQGERGILVRAVSWFDPDSRRPTRYGAGTYIGVCSGDGRVFSTLLGPSWLDEATHQLVLHCILGVLDPEEGKRCGVTNAHRYTGKFWYGSQENLARRRADALETAIRVIRERPEAFFAALDEAD